MKIFIQHKGTGRYLSEEGVWVDDGGLAKDFANAPSAVQFCKERGLKDVQISLKFQTGLPDLNLPAE